MGRGQITHTKPGHLELTVLDPTGQDAFATTSTFEAFPDDCIPLVDAQHSKFLEFIILAAGIIQPGEFALPGDDENSTDEDSVTISGTALLLTPHAR